MVINGAQKRSISFSTLSNTDWLTLTLTDSVNATLRESCHRNPRVWLLSIGRSFSFEINAHNWVIWAFVLNERVSRSCKKQEEVIEEGMSPTLHLKITNPPVKLHIPQQKACLNEHEYELKYLNHSFAFNVRCMMCQKKTWLLFWWEASLNSTIIYVFKGKNKTAAKTVQKKIPYQFITKEIKRCRD